MDVCGDLYGDKYGVICMYVLPIAALGCLCRFVWRPLHGGI